MMTRVDYRRTICFLAFDARREAVIATAMLATEPDRTRAEVAVTTRSDIKNTGVSWSLFEHVLRYAKAEGIDNLWDGVNSGNGLAGEVREAYALTAKGPPGNITLRGVVESCSPLSRTVT